MVEPRHASEKKEKCDVEGCGAEGVRSLSGKKVEKAGLKLSSDPERNARLCKMHYREYKKKSKADRTYDRLGW